ncbi:28703_t:CDS:2 [Dentiscutata erythropus]|uniref:28703_t:CDS:1 n=1 Tax=Dentiscutata erythropus TaxID=1348616 RepID=A0A9N8W3I5_9GLOM|nr:28703_t:CDS:2 [Dentiscutata erythropus]
MTAGLGSTSNFLEFEVFGDKKRRLYSFYAINDLKRRANAVRLVN